MERQALYELVLKCLDNDSTSRHLLYNHVAPLMLGVSCRYARNKTDAEDIFQESLLQFFQNLYQLKEVEKMMGWAKKITVNEAIRFYKKKRNLYFTDVLDEGNQMINDGNILKKIETDQLIKMIQDLPDKMRMVINLYSIEGYKHEEIADMLGISVGTSKSNLFDARKRIKRLLEKENAITMVEDGVKHKQVN